MIIFRKLTFKNILSVGNAPVTVQLDSHKTTLVHGTNGSGKSTILDALTYALFGKSFRKVNLPQLINSQNKKGLLTELEFTIGNTEFTVVRGMKPKVFEVYKNGEKLDNVAANKDMQSFLEQQILKVNYRSFCQIVILGSASFVPFMQLPSMARRECVEDFLDIKVFSTMAVIAKERLRSLKDNVKDLIHEIRLVEVKIDNQEQRVQELEKQSSADITNLSNKIEETQKEIETLEGVIKLRQLEEGVMLREIDDRLKTNPQKRSSNFNNVILKMENKIERRNKEISLYADNDTCHACNQDILPETKEKYIGEAQKDIKELGKAISDATKMKSESDALIEEASELQKKVQAIQMDISQMQNKRDLQAQVVRETQDKLTKVEMESGSVEREKGKLDVLQDELKEQKKKHYQLLTGVEDYEIAVNLLKDSGIKTQIVKRYLPVMNKFIRKYLTDLDLPLHFTLDSEFNETVSSPLHQDFSYGSFSEGQKARIDLALLMTWREVCKLKSSVSMNLLVLDEVFSGSLDETGKELLMTILRYKLENTNVVVVDHTLSGSFIEKFDRAIEVKRPGGFSSYS